MKKWVIAALMVLAAGAWGRGVAAQQTSIRIGVGPISDYPEDFVGAGCEGRHGGASVGLVQRLNRLVALDADVTWTGSLATQCALANSLLSMPAPMDGASYSRTILADEIRGETFAATRLGAVLTPWADATVSPVLRVSGGRLWSKEMWTWTVGAGLRYEMGAHALLLDFERWRFGYDVVHETWTFYQNAEDVLQDRETVRRSGGPWFVRVGWEFAVRGR